MATNACQARRLARALAHSGRAARAQLAALARETGGDRELRERVARASRRPVRPPARSPAARRPCPPSSLASARTRSPAEKRSDQVLGHARARARPCPRAARRAARCPSRCAASARRRGRAAPWASRPSSSLASSFTPPISRTLCSGSRAAAAAHLRARLLELALQLALALEQPGDALGQLGGRACAAAPPSRAACAPRAARTRARRSRSAPRCGARPRRSPTGRRCGTSRCRRSRARACRRTARSRRAEAHDAHAVAVLLGEHRDRARVDRLAVGLLRRRRPA